jgi:hypothetical protein
VLGHAYLDVPGRQEDLKPGQRLYSHDGPQQIARRAKPFNPILLYPTRSRGIRSGSGSLLIRRHACPTTGRVDDPTAIESLRLKAVLCCLWHYPTLATKKKEYGMTLDCTNPCLRSQWQKFNNSKVRTQDTHQ